MELEKQTARREGRSFVQFVIVSYVRFDAEKDSRRKKKWRNVCRVGEE
jgi:hypothetical protein